VSDGSYGWNVRRSVNRGSVPTAWTWLVLPDRLRAVAQRLRGVQIECLPALDLIKRHRNQKTLLYCDPPYPLDLRQRAAYENEMSLADHGLLLESLLAHPGPAVISGYDHPLYSQQLAQWRRAERKTRTYASNVSEFLWINGPALEAQQRLSIPAGEIECSSKPIT
jgi:DNA adenine methylase